MVANIVALGALNSAAGLVSWPALEEAVLERVPSQFREKTNLSIRKIAVITGLNKDKVNKIFKS